MKKGEYVEKIGRRKTSAARVRVFKGKGQSTINGKPFGIHVPTAVRKQKLFEPYEATGIDRKDYYFTATVNGGGTTGQVGAIVLGLARVFAEFSEANKAALKKKGLLTRDPRMVERKKVFLVKARKRPQYSER